MTARRLGPAESRLPKHILDRLEPPDRPRDEKVTIRLTRREYRVLEQFARERGESVSALARKLVVAKLPTSPE